MSFRKKRGSFLQRKKKDKGKQEEVVVEIPPTEEEVAQEDVNNDQEEKERIDDMKLFPDSDKDSPQRVNTLEEVEDAEVIEEVKPDRASLKAALVEVCSNMRTLPFDPSSKRPQYGLPVRLKWQLWIEIAECKLSKELRAQSEHWDIYAKVEVGADAHFQTLQTPLAEQCVSTSWVGEEEAQIPCDRFELYHLRRDKLKVSVWYVSSIPGSSDVCIGHCMYPLKKLQPGTPQLGWVKVKSEKKDKNGEREVKASVRIGFMISDSINAGYLFLIDSKASQVLFYQKVETIDDLNPVFSKHSMKPFSYKGGFGSPSIELRDNNKKSVFKVTPVTGEPLKAIITGIKDDSFLCQLEMNNTGDHSIWTISGSFTGAVIQLSSVPYHKYSILAEVDHTPVAISRHNADPDSNERHARELAVHSKFPGLFEVGEAQWRNARDMKVAVSSSTVDCALVITIVLAIRMIQTVQYASQV